MGGRQQRKFDVASRLPQEGRRLINCIRRPHHNGCEISRRSQQNALGKEPRRRVSAAEAIRRRKASRIRRGKTGVSQSDVNRRTFDGGQTDGDEISFRRLGAEDGQQQREWRDGGRRLEEGVDSSRRLLRRPKAVRQGKPPTHHQRRHDQPQRRPRSYPSRARPGERDHRSGIDERR